MSAEGSTAASIPAGAVRRSLAWLTIANIIAKSSQFVIGILVARILSPHDFGIFAVALVVFSVVINISELGVGTAVIREHDDIKEVAPTAVTLSIISSGALAILMYGTAPAIATSLGSPETAKAIEILSLVVLLAGPNAVPSALLTRDFLQGRRFFIDIANFAVANTLLIILALSGWGVLAFAWSRVAGQVATVIMLHVLSRHRYWPGFNLQQARKLLFFGLPLVSSSLVGYTISSVSTIVLGKLSGATSLGSYTLANNITNWPLGLFSGLIDSLGLPVFSRIHKDKMSLSIYLNNASRVTSAAFFYITTMCVALANPLVSALYGPKWEGAGLILAFFAIFGSVRVLIALYTVVLIACNAPKRLFWIQVTWLAALTPAVFLSVNVAGAVGAAIANVGVSLIVILPLTLWNVQRGTGISAISIFTPTVPPLLAAVAAGLVAAAVSSSSTDPLGALIGGGCAGTALYVGILANWGRRLLRESGRLFVSGSKADKKEFEDRKYDSTSSAP
ncbi:lipopolysaccharide biosynthesis protein [Pseudarthrobacter niigatensis]|uniref:PST family polysaccharide transporter n=1 Tax=Pseudarthrobacter niigatensis TaxID=369935 RepID=A0AAJ1SVI7_9MICC|nr:lipopolysaccharide biosynthesis protein [Pseudarthrobacter niigatensis]MDQ0146994.1 PST family polysaccharide transporter [Pseudarthrobacter niigatensis]MDQ0267905.1 PST family polysaccharide transporter [Pseudarthrobacter niigatensis]